MLLAIVHPPLSRLSHADTIRFIAAIELIDAASGLSAGRDCGVAQA